MIDPWTAEWLSHYIPGICECLKEELFRYFFARGRAPWFKILERDLGKKDWWLALEAA